ncbi:hypothetical protein LTR15_005403 [Elasticomyces elasticus]|nr:hypothetical protein LTR15_005403 [Elasticomyces elasticus]
MATSATDYKAMLLKQKQLTIDAQGRKGQKATNKPGRAFLEMLFAKQGPPPTGYMLRTCFISYAYPPSIIPTAKLKPMLIPELRLETHHRGRVLILRTFGLPQRIQAVQNAVENAEGNVERLALYNTDPKHTPEQSLPRGVVIAVREPFYKATMDGGYTIRVDHPSDLVRLPAGHESIPAAFAPRLVELELPAEGFKMSGNAAYAKKDFLGAVDCYSQGLRACSEDDGALRYDLHRNRANANLLLGRFEGALADAEAAIIPVPAGGELDEASKKLNGKAYYRAGRAAYALRMFAKADGYFQDVERCTAGDEDAKRERVRVASRIREESKGAYEFAAMSKSSSITHNRLDHADFVAAVEIKSAGQRGRGLFATRNIKVGDLILCEKAFGVVLKSEKTTETYTMMNLNTNRGSMGPHATLLFDIVQKLSHNPEQAKLYFDLHDGGYEPKLTPEIVDGVTVVDTFRTAAISEFNRFGCPNVRSSDGATQRTPSLSGDEDEDDFHGSIGVWRVASYVNHACSGNAVRAFIGDMMIIRATRDIKAGDEVTMRYTNPKEDGPASRKKTKDSWGFECDCAICMADLAVPPKQLERRRALNKEVEKFLGSNRLTLQSRASAANIRKAEKFHAMNHAKRCPPHRASTDSQSQDLVATYDPAVYAGKPCLALIGLGQWLCQAHNFESSQRQVIACANRSLANLGYGIKIVRKKLTIDYTHRHTEATAIDAAMYAAHAHRYLGEENLGLQYTKFAKQLWETLYGELKWFKERFGPE